MRTHYEVLEISSSAAPDDVRRAYNGAILRLHPDKQRDSIHVSPSSTSCVKEAADFAAVQAAWKVLYLQ